MQFSSQWFLFGAVVLFTLAAAVTDLRTRRLPNWLTVPAFLAALLFHLAIGGWAGLGGALAGFAIGFGVLFVLWLIGGGGGGDVKLMGALGAWLGPMSTVFVFFLSTLLAVVGTIGMMLYDLLTQGFRPMRGKYFAGTATPGRRKPTLEEQQRRRQKRRVLPYAAPVALATWAVLAWRLVQGHM